MTCGRAPPPVCACTLGVALACLWSAAAGVGAQQVRGSVLEAGSRQPLAEATLTVLDDAGRRLARVTTDSVGAFSSVLPRAGAYVLRVEKLGYQTLDTEPFTVTGNEILDLRIFVGVEAVALAPVEVTARRREPPGSHPDFRRRTYWGRQTGDGRFFTREDIRKTGLIRTTSLLRQVPSVPLASTRDGGAVLAPSRHGGLNCRAAVFLNGMEVHARVPLDDLVALDELEGIEVYRWRSEVPLELAASDVCSAIAFWTRIGNDENVNASPWRRILAGGAAVTGAVLVGLLMR